MTTASQEGTYRLLLDILNKTGPRTSRVLTALRWYNAANRQSNDDLTAIVHLAIAFEALLGLPHSEKTDRLADAIALLLGRTPRLDIWASQFYEARSKIVHEGYTDQLYFVATRDKKNGNGYSYQSLLSYGRQVFRLCLDILLVGADLADRAGLEEQLVTNQERFVILCRIMDDDAYSPQERLTQATEIVEAIERNRFIGENGLRLETILAAVRLTAKAVLASDIPIEPDVSDALQAMASAPKAPDHYEELDALCQLDNVLPNVRRQDIDLVEILRMLAKAVWGMTFLHHHWIKKHRSDALQRTANAEEMRANA